MHNSRPVFLVISHHTIKGLGLVVWGLVAAVASGRRSLRVTIRWVLPLALLVELLSWLVLALRFMERLMLANLKGAGTVRGFSECATPAWVMSATATVLLKDTLARCFSCLASSRFLAMASNSSSSDVLAAADSALVRLLERDEKGEECVSGRKRGELRSGDSKVQETAVKS